MAQPGADDVRPSLAASVAWMDQARCIEYDADYAEGLFFAERSSNGVGGKHDREAFRICLLCPVRLDCLATALMHDDDGDLYGIWAGVTREERQATANLPIEIRGQLLDQMARSKAVDVLTPAEAAAL